MSRRLIILGVALVLSVTYSCDSSEDQVVPNDLTGNSVTYALEPASYWNITGTVTFNEKKDGTTRIEIKLNGLTDTNADSEFPAHLHFGDVTTDKADVAALLKPVDLKTGVSKTDMSVLSDETLVTFDDLKKLGACVKIHLAAYGEGKNVVLAAGNIGSYVTEATPNGRAKIGICKSE
jgi:hypothetical protein